MSRKRILVIWREGEGLEEVMDLLRLWRYEVLGPVGRRDCSEVFARRKVDLSLIRVDVLDRRSLDFGRRIFRRYRIPVFYLADSCDSAFLARARITCSFSYLLYPFREEDFRTSLRLTFYKHALEREVQSRGRWFSAVLENTSEIILGLDLRGRICFLNRAARLLVGGSEEVGVGGLWGEVLGGVERSREFMEQVVGEVIGEGKEVRGVEIRLEVGGEDRVFSLDGVPIFSGWGELEGGLLVFLDISQRRVSERRLRESYARMQKLREVVEEINGADQLSDVYEAALQGALEVLGAKRAAILIYDEEGRVQFRSHRGIPLRYIELLEASASCRDCRRPEGERDFVPRSLESELEGLDFEGEEFMRACLCFPLESENRVLGKYVVCYDEPRELDEDEVQLGRVLGENLCVAVERIQAKRTLAREKDLLLVTLKSIGEGVIATDGEGRIEFLNQEAEVILGITLEGFRGRYLEEVFCVYEERSDRVWDPAGEVLRTGIPLKVSRPCILRTRGGEERMISFNIFPLRHQGGEIRGCVVAFQDVSDRERMALELQKAQKLESLGFLAGGIAHDFNNILTAVVGNLALCKMKAQGDEEVLQLLEEALRAVQQGKELTRQLLMFSKGEAPVKQTVSIEELVRESATFALRGSNVQCRFDFPPLWPVEVDSSQMHQVFHNLVLNAVQAMPDGGTIVISGRNIPAKELGRGLLLESGDYICISIRDEGEGISKENLARIFDPYFTTKRKGSGLGLATCISIISRHKGTITVESALGEGSTFYIYLPASSRPVEVEDEVELPELVRGEGRVLVMDDEEMILSLTRKILEKMGFEVDFARRGEEVVELYRRRLEAGEAYRFVIMDLTIPGGMGAKETVRRILELDAEAKVVVSSGYLTDPIMRHYREYGFFACLCKPYEMKDFVQIVRSI